VRFTLVLVLALGLSACQSTKIVEKTDSLFDQAALKIRETQLENLIDFQFLGGLGVWTDAESLSARVLWQESAESLQLDLSGPLGIGDLRLHRTSGVVTLLRGGDVIAKGVSAGKVLQQALGLSVPIPVGQLQLWVKGLPGAAEAVSRDVTGKIDSLYYQDASGTKWEARFKQYQVLGGLTVPALITASGGPYSVRLRLKNWQMNTKKDFKASDLANKRLPIPSR